MVVALLHDSLQGYEPCDMFVEAHDEPPMHRVERDGLYTGEGAHRTGDVADFHHPQESVYVQDRPLHGRLLEWCEAECSSPTLRRPGRSD
jgi:hypothetical protein